MLGGDDIGKDSRIDEFVETLRTAEMPTETADGRGMVNIYDDVHDPDGWRKDRLRRFLKLPRDGYPLVLFVGEAPGLHGAAVTGVPFSSVETLTAPGFERLHQVISDEEFATIEGTQPNFKETSARQFWRVVLAEFEDLPLPVVWNAVPFWPLSVSGNATPSRWEEIEGSRWLETVVNWCTYAEVVAVGRSAERGLRRIGSQCRYVRHPSRGGASEFESGVRAIVDSLRSR